MKAKIVAELEKITKMYQSAGDKGRVIGYAKAINSIKSYAFPISDYKQMDEIPSVGDKIKQKVKAMFRYNEDFAERMPRTKATEITDTVAKAFKDIHGTMVKVLACGSYRRERPTCGSITLLVTRTDDKPVKGMLEPVLVNLEKSGFLHERFGSTSLDKKSADMFYGVCKSARDTCFRRISIRLYPKEQFAFATLFFTGSEYFTRSMKLLAEEKELKLTETGLVPMKGFFNLTGSKAISTLCETEMEIFKALGTPYRTPKERDI